MTKRTITLSNRPPVSISDENWPIIASASDKDYDNQYEFQANRISKWFIGVRQHQEGEFAHEDEKFIVYATYSYSSNWQNARVYSAKSGYIFGKDDDMAAAILSVADDIASKEHNGNDASRWATLRDECIADLPAEELD